MDLQQFFLKRKQAIHHGTLEVIEKVPADQLAWRPAKGMLSLGEIVRHLWTSEGGVLAAALDNEWGYYDKRVPEGLASILSVAGPVDKPGGRGS